MEHSKPRTSADLAVQVTGQLEDTTRTIVTQSVADLKAISPPEPDIFQKADTDPATIVAGNLAVVATIAKAGSMIAQEMANVRPLPAMELPEKPVARQIAIDMTTVLKPRIMRAVRMQGYFDAEEVLENVRELEPVDPDVHASLIAVMPHILDTMVDSQRYDNKTNSYWDYVEGVEDRYTFELGHPRRES